jgi:rod shape-determining protein MreD
MAMRATTPSQAYPPIDRQAKRLQPGAAIGIAIAALVLQIILPLYLRWAGLLDLMLLVVVYMALLRRNVVSGVLTGAAIGMAQDALTHGPIGLFGIINTVIGYLGASVSQFVEVDYPGARSVLAGLFFLVHQALFWVVQGGLLGNAIVIDLPRALVLAAVHAGLSLPMYSLFDRFKKAH